MEIESDYNGRNPRLTENTENQLREKLAKIPHWTLYTKSLSTGGQQTEQISLSLCAPTVSVRVGEKNGIIYTGAQVIVTQSMQKDVLRKIHAHHFGGESNILMAREVLFWSGNLETWKLGNFIQEMCDACSTYAQYSPSAPKEPMKSLPIPTGPWQIVSQDFCQLEKQRYLVTVCHFSDWIDYVSIQIEVVDLISK